MHQQSCMVRSISIQRGGHEKSGYRGSHRSEMRIHKEGFSGIFGISFQHHEEYAGIGRRLKNLRIRQIRGKA